MVDVRLLSVVHTRGNLADDLHDMVFSVHHFEFVVGKLGGVGKLGDRGRFRGRWLRRRRYLHDFAVRTIWVAV